MPAGAGAGAGSTPEPPFAPAVAAAGWPAAPPARPAAAREGHGRASPAAHAGGSPLGHLPAYRIPIITIQKAGTTCSSAPPIGSTINSPVNIPRKAIQRTSSPTRSALIISPIIPTASTRPAISAR